MTDFGFGTTIVVDPPAVPPVVAVPTPGGRGADGVMNSVQPGAHVAVDDTDPANPIVSLGTLTAADVGADPAGSAAAAQTAAIAAADTYTDGAVAGEATARVSAISTAIAALASVYQPLDGDLTAIAALTTTSFGRNLLALLDAAALRSAAGLGTAATADTTAFDPAGAATTAQTAAQAYTDAETSRAETVEAAKADLVVGKVPTSQLPTLSIANTYPVADETAMLALAADPGDIALRADTSPHGWMLMAAPAATLANWLHLGTGGGSVDSVNGQTGIVVLGASDVGADASGAASSALTTAEAYTDSAVTSEVTRANAAYDAAGAAAAAQSASQPLDATLTALAGLATAADKLPYFTGADIASVTTLSAFIRTLLDDADAATARGTLGLGTAATAATGDFDAAGAAAAAQAASQPLDSDLTAIAALATTAFGRSFLALVDAAAGRTLLGLGTLATQSGTFSGTSSGTNTGDQDLSALAPKASPALTGTPTVPTAAPGTNSTQAASTAYADAAAAAAAVGLLDYRGSYNASGNVFPSSGGSGTAGAVLKGDFWICSVAGTLGGTAVSAGDLIIAIIDTPGTTAANWDLIEHDVGYAPENVANKSTDGTFAANSATLYPSQSAVKTYADAVATASVPNALFDANTVLAATTDNTPAALTVAASTFLGRKATGNIAAMSVAEAITLLALSSASLSDFTEAVQDVVGAFVVAGSGVSVTYDDAGNTETISDGPLTINAQTGTSYTLVLADAPKFVSMSNASASTLTVPPNSSVAFAVGTVIEGAQLGAGQVTLTAGAGVTINATPGLKVAAQYGSFALIKTATDTWLAVGRLSA